MARLVVTASLVLFSDQASGSIGLCSGSQFDPRKLRLVSLLLDSDRTMLANSKAMWLQLATFGCHATEFMQIPKAARDLIHRPDDDFGLVIGYFVANDSPEHACLGIRWASRFGWVFTLTNAPTCCFTDGTASLADRCKGGGFHLLLQLSFIELSSNGEPHHRASSKVKVNKLVN